MNPAFGSTASMHSDGRRRRAGIRGFTLVEVLVAVLVLSVGVLGVAGLTLGVAGESRRSARVTARTLAAQRALDSIRRVGFGAVVDGRSTLLLDGAEWTVTWQVVREAAGLKRVDVRVSTGPGAERGRPFAAARLHRMPTLSGGRR